MRLDLDGVRSRHPIPAVAGAALKLHRAGREWKACCPFHSDRTPSFTVFDSGRRFKCFGCGAAGDVLDFVQRLHGVGLRDAAIMLEGGGIPHMRFTGTTLPAERVDRCGEAIGLWRAASAADGTPAQAYLKGRGISLVPPSLRFARLSYGSRDGLHPAIVAAIQSVAGPVQGVQRTFLRSDGVGKLDVPKPKLSLGRVKGGAIRLGPVADELVLVEGLEDGLTLAQALPGASVWACCGTEMLPAVDLPHRVRSIVIAADNDAAGAMAADKAGEAYARQGLSVRIMRPAPAFKDFNDELRRITS